MVLPKSMARQPVPPLREAEAMAATLKWLSPPHQLNKFVLADVIKFPRKKKKPKRKVIVVILNIE